MDNYDVRSDEDSSDEPPELVDMETLVYEEEVVQYCEWEIIEPATVWGPEREAKSCYEPKVTGGRYCHLHKCRGCFRERSYKSKYCMECPCPVVGCELPAYACGNRCSCCEKYHRKMTIGWRTCEACLCHICGEGPIIERYETWGDVHLCQTHSTCVVVGCTTLCGSDNPRYCPKHKSAICQRLHTLELCLLRKKQPRDMRLYICNWYKWFLENFLICNICKGFYRDKCQQCDDVRQKTILGFFWEIQNKCLNL